MKRLVTCLALFCATLQPAVSTADELTPAKVADIKQCTLEGEADHVLAACFLSRFRAKRPWVHVDLAAAQCKGGLGAVAADTTGFGVAWGAAFLSAWLGGEGGINTFGTT
mgnify:CR=1 FL=1